MKKIRITYLVLLCLVCHLPVLGQVDSTAIDTVMIDYSVLDTVSLQQVSDTAGAEEKKPLFKVVPWEFHAPLGAEISATDSTMRWQNWPDWTYKLNRQPGVISYRMGTSMRTNAVQHFAHEPRHQQLYWEGISLNDPVTGTLNWNLIPQHKISTFYDQDLGTEHRSTYYLRQYYLNEPLSRLMYSESKFSARDLEFEVSHNLSQRTNIEASYWDRRVGGEYDNSSVSGRQIYAKISHHLSHRRYLKINYINNKYDVGRPFGYLIPDMRTFNFDRFTTRANQSAALSTDVSSLLAVNLYQRSPDTTEALDDLHAGIFYRGSGRQIEYLADSTRYKLRSFGFTSRKWYRTGALSLQGGLNYEYFFNQSTDERSLPAPNWGLLEAEGRVSLEAGEFLDLYGLAGYNIRGDGYKTFRLNVNPEIHIADKVTLSAGLSSGKVMPTPQQLYWSSEEYSGRDSLHNEHVLEGRAELSYHFTPQTQIGVRLQHKDIRNGIFVAADSTFTNVSAYASRSAVAFFELNTSHIEFDGSATLHRFEDSYRKPDGIIPMRKESRFWLNGNLFWKGYLFHRATYIKAGLSGMMSPFRYRADHYNPVLDHWQAPSDDQLLPVYSRLDVDISARVRSIIFVLRWENVLDDVSQLGYFETANYPMSQRRFIFSVKAFFRN